MPKSLVQKEDPGELPIVGFSAGARSKPQFHWVRNLLRKMSDDDALDFRWEQSSAFALIWNILRKRLPPEIQKEWIGWLKNGKFPAMNPEWADHADNRGSYSICVKGETIKFNNAELAPPTGVMAQNYARYVWDGL